MGSWAMSEITPWRRGLGQLEAIITGWEQRIPNPPTDKSYLVQFMGLAFNHYKLHKIYRIVMRAGEDGREAWEVLRRYSDFAKFHEAMLGLRPAALQDLRLPPKHGLWTMSTETEEVFLVKRLAGLNRYLDELIKAVGVDDLGFWNHPIVMTFFDIPSPTREAFIEPNKCTTLDMWDAELETARGILTKAVESNHRMSRQSSSSPLDPSNTLVRHQRRQINALQKKIEALQVGLIGLQQKQINQSQAPAIEERRVRLEQLQKECLNLIDQLNGGFEVAAEKEALLATKSPKKHPVPEDDPSKILQTQQLVIQEQDQTITKIEELAIRNKKIAAAIKEEVDQQNRILDRATNQTEEANVKIGIASHKIEKI